MLQIKVILLSFIMAFPAWATEVNTEANLNTDLIVAASNGKTDSVKALLGKGANVDAKDKDGATALIRAALKGDVETVKTLVESGADVNAKDNKGITALTVAKLKGNTETIALLKKAGAVEGKTGSPEASE